MIGLLVRWIFEEKLFKLFLGTVKILSHGPRHSLVLCFIGRSLLHSAEDSYTALEGGWYYFHKGYSCHASNEVKHAHIKQDCMNWCIIPQNWCLSSYQNTRVRVPIIFRRPNDRIFAKLRETNIMRWSDSDCVSISLAAAIYLYMYFFLVWMHNTTRNHATCTVTPLGIISETTARKTSSLTSTPSQETFITAYLNTETRVYIYSS